MRPHKYRFFSFFRVLIPLNSQHGNETISVNFSLSENENGIYTKSTVSTFTDNCFASFSYKMFNALSRFIILSSVYSGVSIVDGLCTCHKSRHPCIINYKCMNNISFWHIALIHIKISSIPICKWHVLIKLVLLNNHIHNITET